MGIRNLEYPEGHPNAKLYELVYDDGERYTFRQGGREPVRAWNLAGAVMWANHMASREQTMLHVLDPLTGTVVWTGEVTTR